MDCKGCPIRCRHRAIPSRAFRLLGPQTRTTFQLHKASSSCPSSSSSEASAHRVRVSVGQSVNRVCSRVTHFIHDVAGSDQVVGLGCGTWRQCSSPCLPPLRFLASSFKIPPVSCRSSSTPASRTSTGRIPLIAHSVLLSGLERNCVLTVLLKMANTSHPLIADHCCKNCRSRFLRGKETLSILQNQQ